MGKGCRCRRGCCCDACGGCRCGCRGGGGFKRRYRTRAEEVAELETYLKELKNEVKAVQERLADLERTK